MSIEDLWPPRVPKVCGADVELGNFVLGAPQAPPGYAARALLNRIDGVSSKPPTAEFAACSCGECVARRASAAVGRWPSIGGVLLAPNPDGAGGASGEIDPQDWGRRFLAENGGCAYIDLDHLELCLPETRSAFDHVACWHAMLRIARRALVAANRAETAGRTIQVLVNNRDGQGNSYGSHLDFLITRRAWNNIFSRRMHYLLYLAAYQVSSIVFTGQGKVGADNGRGEASFQLSQRADFMETLTGVQTTFNRPIVNSRDEPLCGAVALALEDRSASGDRADRRNARLHSIFFDSTLCHVASLLKVGVMQIVLAMIEAERVNAGLVLDDPLEALGIWSRDPSLQTRARLASGASVTAVELQRRFFDEASAFAASGELDEVVPRADEILGRWDDTLRKLEARDFASLAPQLDWVLKRSLLDRVMQQRPDLAWESAAIRHLDHVYSSLDTGDGLYWACEEQRAVERVVSDREIERFTAQPPDDTRAWTRAMLLRATDREAVDHVDWDWMRVGTQGRSSRTVRRFDMPHPARFGRAEAEPCLRSADTLDDALDALDALRGTTERGETHHEIS